MPEKAKEINVYITTPGLSDHQLPEDTVEISVELNQPPLEELRKYDRARRFQILSENAVEQRRELVNWIRDNGLGNEVIEVREPNVFGVLYITSTHKGMEALKNAPGVVEVSQTPEFQVDLPAPTARRLSC